ncbi:MAG: hypothetical protein MUQ10_18710 [Anaerolineae bacterium]|nr:hypothetical protein [Anaerolineae bacterium]
MENVGALPAGRIGRDGLGVAGVVLAGELLPLSAHISRIAVNVLWIAVLL